MASAINDLRKVDWHTLSKEEVLHILESRIDGLTDTEVRERLSLYGYNEIMEEKRRSPFAIFAKQFKEPLIIILLAATAISALIGELIDAVVIIAIVILATVVGFVQEYRSEKAIEALKKMAAPTARVIRNGGEKIIDARELVPGDVILVSVGDRIPADAFLLESFNLETDEASLTGESTPVEKRVETLPKETAIADRKNLLYMISAVTHGRGKAVVFATGMSTELGRIAGAVQTIEIGKTPFEIRIRQIGKLLSIIMLVVVCIISIIGFLRGHAIIEMMIWGISLAVAAVPEALPAVVAASLTIGVYRMAKQNAIVRRLPAVETLGSTTIICSDKTGTLTKGEMTVRKIYIYDRFADVTGVGYNSEGGVVGLDIGNGDINLLAKAGALCNDANVRVVNGMHMAMGDPTEASLVVLARKVGLSKDKLDAEFPRVYEVQFSSERKRMTTVNRLDDKYFAFMKGATETVIEHCNKVLANGGFNALDDKVRTRIMSVNNEMAGSGLRVLAIAYKELDTNHFSEDYVESGLTFIGLAGMMDPPRAEVIDAVAQCKSAGIDVIMITGDHKLTAEAIAKEIGVADKVKSMTGRELEEVDLPLLEKKVEEVKVYARVSPEHKLKIVQALKNRGHIVAMTGDGINDAAALKASDIGIAMGITGTQVTKEASSIVLTDDNFASIVSAVREGRRIMDNVKKYLVYLLPVNIGEIILFAFAVMMGWPLPLLAKHILYINLATDGSPAIALGMEPAEPDIMKRKPRNPKESIFSNTLQWFAGVSIIIAAISIFLFWYVLELNGWTEFAVNKARTMLFGLIVFEEIFFALSCRSLKHSIPTLGFFSNRLLLYSLIGESLVILFIMNHAALMEIFGLIALGMSDWILIMILAPTTFLYSEIVKAIARKRQHLE
ncbi:MAG: cation-translocating P-type ATPase [Nitrososphaerales archaeon]